MAASQAILSNPSDGAAGPGASEGVAGDAWTKDMTAPIRLLIGGAA